MAAARPGPADPVHRRHRRRLALRVLADPGGGPVGITVPDATLTRLHGRYQTNALALEIMARDLPPGGWLDVDQVVLHLLKRS